MDISTGYFSPISQPIWMGSGRRILGIIVLNCRKPFSKFWPWPWVMTSSSEHFRVLFLAYFWTVLNETRQNDFFDHFLKFYGAFFRIFSLILSYDVIIVKMSTSYFSLISHQPIWMEFGSEGFTGSLFELLFTVFRIWSWPWEMTSLNDNFLEPFFAYF